jgi:aromatic ring-opening dioxygenase catalytic subunit (LigB family)
MLIGTGMAVHNLKVINRFTADDPPAWVQSWLDMQKKMVEEYSGERREIRSKQMTFNSNYRNAHPTSEHLLPLHFAIG